MSSSLFPFCDDVMLLHDLAKILGTVDLKFRQSPAPHHWKLSCYGCVFSPVCDGKTPMGGGDGEENLNDGVSGDCGVVHLCQDYC